MDEIRQSELIQSSRILGIDQVSILDYQDGMNETWQLNDIVQSLHENFHPQIVVVILIAITSHQC